MDHPGLRVVADRTVAAMSDFCCGANEEDYHLTGVNWGRDLPEPEVADIRNVVAGDPSPDGRGALEIERGIEVGHVFQLRTTYTEKMGVTYIDEKGAARPMEMGCYGIGVTRVVAAAIEQNHDDRGIIWPDPMAPFVAAVIPLGYRKSEAVREAAEKLYAELSDAGVDVLLDDRDERPGVLFADQELIGIPHRLVRRRARAQGRRGRVPAPARRGRHEGAARRGGRARALAPALRARARALSGVTRAPSGRAASCVQRPSAGGADSAAASDGARLASGRWSPSRIRAAACAKSSDTSPHSAGGMPPTGPTVAS